MGIPSNSLSQEAQYYKGSFKVNSCWKLFYKQNFLIHLGENGMNCSVSEFVTESFVKCYLSLIPSSISSSSIDILMVIIFLMDWSDFKKEY